MADKIDSDIVDIIFIIHLSMCMQKVVDVFDIFNFYLNLWDGIIIRKNIVYKFQF